MSADEKKKNEKNKAARVAVIMGSDSDLDAMKPCIETLESFGVAIEVTIASAHRTPAHLEDTVKKFAAGGGEVVIAAAGGAAHLPGVIASMTLLPVIGVPMKSSMLGLDSLLSIVQMPAGVPVATVGVNGAANAALLAVEILALGSAALREKLADFRRKQADKVIAKSEKLKEKR
jgi:5-(carboxyamino)imidazole ribonucleotide mutase